MLPRADSTSNISPRGVFCKEVKVSGILEYMDNMSNYIFGIDVTRNNITATEVRDALIPCFAAAQQVALMQDEKPTNLSPGESEHMGLANAEAVVKKFFFEVGGDYDRPTKRNIEDVIAKLAEYSKNFRNDDIVNKSREEMLRLVERLS